MSLRSFLWRCLQASFRGGRNYGLWLFVLIAAVLSGVIAWSLQLREGLVVTGMSDQVSWGIYVANFTFIEGVAASVLILVIPTYVFRHKHAERVVLLAHGVAAACCVMCLLFALVDMGRPGRFIHFIPGIGRLNWPDSMLAWDLIGLMGFLFINLTLPIYILFQKARGLKSNPWILVPGIAVAILWAVAMELITAFLFSTNPARPYWNTAMLAPKFAASSFSSGPALMIISFFLMERVTSLRIGKKTYDFLSLVVTVALQFSLFIVAAELFIDFHSPASHAAGTKFLFGASGGLTMVHWIVPAILLQASAMVILMVHRLRSHEVLRGIACGMTLVGVWIEKGLGLVIPGFVPTPLGEVFGYQFTLVETLVSLGIWAMGTLMFTMLARPAVRIEVGQGV